MFPPLGFHAFILEFFAQNIVAVVKHTNSGSQAEHSFFMLVLLHESFFVFNIIHHVFNTNFSGFQFFTDTKHFSN